MEARRPTQSPTPRLVTAPYPGPQPVPPLLPTQTPTRQSQRLTGTYNAFLPLILRDASSAPNVGLGLERYWTFQAFALTERVVVRVNGWNGNLVAQYAAFNIPSRGLPLTLAFTYNSQSNAWTHNLNWSLTLGVTNSVVLRDGDGTEHFFRREASGAYTAPAGNFDTLVRNADQTFTLTHPDQTQHRFDANGRLTQIRDRAGNTVALTYTNGQLTHAQAAGGQTLTFAYSGGSLGAVTDHAGRAFQFGYTGGALTSITDPMNFVTRFAYTSNRLTTLTDPRTTSTTFAYDANQRAQTITTAGTRVASFAYSANTTTFTDANNNATAYTINSTGQVTQIRDARDGITTFTYDANYNITRTVDALNRVTRATYDARGNLLTTTNALEQTTTYTYNATNDLLSVTDPLGRVTRYTYDAAGNLISVTDALNNVTTYGYDAYGQRTQTIDAENRTTNYAYNAAGYLTTLTDAASGITRYGYDAVGHRTVITDANTRVTHYTYDTNNRLTRVDAPLGATTRYEYDANGNRTATIDALNQRTTFTYDAFNRLTAVTDALNQTTRYQYDANGNRTRVIDANGNATNYQYDALNRLTRSTDASNNATQYGYDAVGNRTVITDARGNATTYSYDALNRLTATTIPLTSTQTATTRYGYDAVGNRTVITDANGNVTRYGYDRLNRTIVITDALGHARRYGYDRVGNRTVITDAATNVTRYDYDKLNRVITITNPTGKLQTFGYDAVGNRTRVTDELSQTTRYAYDALNRVISVTNPLTQTTTYDYNRVGNVITITNPTGQLTTFGYDAANRLTRKTTPLGTTQYAYDNVGNLRVLTDPSGATTTYTYDAVNRVTQQDDRAPGGATTVSYAFAYDANGNRTQETEARPGKPYRITDYAYNKANWLVETRAPYNATTTYNYDAAGNRTSVTDPLGITTAVTYNALNLPAQTTHSTNPLVDTTTNTYDARQNLQRAVTVAGGLTLTTTYTYNGNNYLTALNNASQGAHSGSHDYSLAYTDHNLVRSVTPGYYMGDYVVVYDSVARVRCWQNGGFLSMVIWSYYPDSNRKYQYSGFYPINGCPATPYEGEPGQNYFATREYYEYNGQRLTRREWQPYGAWDPPNAPPWMVSTYSYDGSGNLTQEVRVNYRDNVTTTTSYNWTWQGGAHRLTSFTSSDGVTTTLDYDSLGRITRRYNSLGYSDYIYEDGTDWLVRETWRSAISGNVFDLVRYWYTNGRPSRVEVAATSGDLQYVYGYNAYYIQYNWHGDAVTYIALDGTGGGSWGAYDPWGNASFWPPPGLAAWHYYRWNSAWGYLRFDALNLYYAHGRWYNPETALFLSPDENGSYIYYDNDPVNKHADAPPPRHNWPSECTPGITNYDPRDLTCWLFREMKTNLNDPRLQAVRRANLASRINPIFFPTANYAGALQFYLLVADQRPWDFKHRILDYLGPGITLCQSAGCSSNVEYSVPGNIHFGFVAREAGYEGQIIQAGAGVAEIFDPSHRNWLLWGQLAQEGKGPGYTPYEGQFGYTSGSWCFGPFGWSLNLGDQAEDHQAVQFGIYLYDKYAGGRGLTFPAFQMELAKAIPHFATRSPFPWSVPNTTARDWPYWLGYFDPTR